MLVGYNGTTERELLYLIQEGEIMMGMRLSHTISVYTEPTFRKARTVLKRSIEDGGAMRREGTVKAMDD